MSKAAVIEYSGLGEHDEDLQVELEEILSKFNEAQDTNFVYLPESGEFEGYWSVRSSEDPDAADFRMFVVYDDETEAYAYNDAQKALVEEVLDAMQECSERDGFEESLRHTDFYDVADFKAGNNADFPSPEEFFDMIKASWKK